MKIKGLDDLSRQFKELERALAELDGDIAKVSFDPQDPASIDHAVQQAHSSIDAKVAGFSNNAMVQEIADDLKERARASILDRAAAARAEGDEFNDD